MDADAREQAAWPFRAAGLALAGAAIGAAYSLLVPNYDDRGGSGETMRLFAATFLVGGIAFAFAVERVRAAWSLTCARAAGLLVALVSGDAARWLWGHAREINSPAWRPD